MNGKCSAVQCSATAVAAVGIMAKVIKRAARQAKADGQKRQLLSRERKTLSILICGSAEGEPKKEIEKKGKWRTMRAEQQQQQIINIKRIALASAKMCCNEMQLEMRFASAHYAYATWPALIRTPAKRRRK